MLKLLIIMFLIATICVLIILIKNKGVKKEEQNEIDNKIEFNDSGEKIISKSEYIDLLRKNVVDLIEFVKNIPNKDDDDNIQYENLIKALQILHVQDNNEVSDIYVNEIIKLVHTVEKYYNFN